MVFAPTIEGVVPVRSPAEAFLRAFRERVAAGLLMGRPHPRSNYGASEGGAGVLRVRAADFWTAINVGLNDVQLRLPSNGTVEYQVTYWRWASFSLGLSGVLGLTGLVLILAFDLRGYIASHATARLPGLSIDQNLAIAWGMVIFWGFLWPWPLIAFHKPALRRLLERLVSEVDTQAAGH